MKPAIAPDHSKDRLQFTAGRWIISAQQDLVWIQGSVLSGLALLGLFLLLPPLHSANFNVLHPTVLLLLLWGVLLDGTHVWGTYARTYFAADQASRAGLPSALAWGWLVLGPIIALLDYLCFTPSPSLIGQAGLLFQHFLVVAYLWAYWHLVRQHYGILVLYRRKGGESSGHLDTLFLWLCTLYPYLRFSLSESYLHSGLPQPLPFAWFDSVRITLDVLFIVGLIVLAWYRLQTKQRWCFGPKQLFLGIVAGFHLLVFALLDNLLVITAVLTIFHNLQYHRIVWQYEQGHGRVPMGTISRYLGCGLLFGCAWYGPRMLGVATVETDLVRNLLLGLGWGVAFHHYYVDARIWKVRCDPKVAEALNCKAIT